MPSRINELSSTQIVADLLKDHRRQAAAATSVQLPQPAKDALTIGTNGQPASWQLAAIPYQGSGGSSVNLSLNGWELDEGVDYTVDYTTGIVSFSSAQQALFRATPTPADVLTADYWTTGDLIALSGSVDTGKLSIPEGATWKYLTNVGADYHGFGLDGAPTGADAVYAQPSYDDSAWSSGITPFIGGTGNGPGTGYGSGGTQLPLDSHAGSPTFTGMRVWARHVGVTSGGPLTITYRIDNAGWFYVDGTVVGGSTASGTGSFSSPGTFTTPSAGTHTFAFWGVGDVATDIASWTVTES